MKHVLIYGDSNTWGFVPGRGERYPRAVRWTGVAAELLGREYDLNVNGLNARTTVFPDPFKPFLRGEDMLYGTLVSAKPLDLLVLALGTNDLKFTDAYHSSLGVEKLIRMAQTCDALWPAAQAVFPKGPRILVLSPIEIGAALETLNPLDDLAGKHEESRRLAGYYQAVCSRCGADLLDAAKVAGPSQTDCVHMDPAGHAALGRAVAERIRGLLG